MSHYVLHITHAYYVSYGETVLRVHAGMRQHARERVSIALQKNSVVKDADRQQVAEQLEAECFARAQEGGNPRSGAVLCCDALCVVCRAAVLLCICISILTNIAHEYI